MNKSLIIAFLSLSLLLNIVQCSSETDNSIFKLATLHPTHNYISTKYIDIDSRKQDLLDFWEMMETPQIDPIYNLHEEWYYVLGTADESLKTRYKPLDMSLARRVSIRHREFEPNSSMWYYRSINLEKPVIAHIRADDGAQLFVDGEQVYQFKPYYYEIPSGELEIAVRVLNNAVGGGLTSVLLFDIGRFEQYQSDSKKYNDLDFIIQKVLQLKNPPENYLKSVTDVLLGNREIQTLSAIPHITVGPFLQVTDHNKFELRWKSDSPTSTLIVQNQSDHQSFSKIIHPNGEGIFKYRFYDLTPGEKIDYQIHLENDQVSELFSFSLPVSEEKVSFTAWGDSQNRPHIFNQITHGMSQFEDHFSISLGDLVSDGANPYQWYSFFSGLSPYATKTPLFLIAGNHDYDGYYDYLQPEQFLKYVYGRKLYRSLYFENVAIISLDPNINFPIGIHEGSDQYNWFINEIESNSWKNADWKIVALHQPPYAQSWPTYHGDKVIEELLKPLYEEGKIDVVLSGHTHAYERLVKTNKYGDDILFVISGGAGGNLEPEENETHPEMDVVKSIHHFVRFELEKNQLTLKAYSTDMKVFDEVIITRH